jgi:hypothetical protein
MMLIDNKFELGIPTHIYFTLYKFDLIDSIIISRVIKECKNWNESGDENLFTVDVESFKSAIRGNKRLDHEITKAEVDGLAAMPGNKPNSVTFLWSIIERLENLEWMTFSISYDKKFSRVVKIENKEIMSFYFKIEEGIFDLTQVFQRSQLDIINKKIIEYKIMPNKYLERSSYFYMKASLLFEILGQLEIDGTLGTFDLLDHIDQKLEEDDPTLLVKTDYTPY